MKPDPPVRCPWGESYDDLAAAVSADRDAPPVLALAAFLYRHGEETALRRLIAKAVALNEAERAS